VRLSDARALIAPGIPPSGLPSAGASWADLGAGTGTFTRVLAEILGPMATIYAVERDEDALGALRDRAAAGHAGAARIVVVEADFTKSLSLPRLSGIIAANALHFVSSDTQAGLLSRLAALLEPSGRIILVEYDRDHGNPYVPFPISRARLQRLALEADLGVPSFVASLPSQYGGELYSAVLKLPSA
jgi:SAM-dependent methyltransferase